MVHSLPIGFVKDFEQLYEMFVQCFAVTQKINKDVNHLFSME